MRTLRYFLAVVILSISPLKAAEYSITRSYVRPIIIVAQGDGVNGSMVVIAPGFALSANHVVEAAKQRKAPMVTLVGSIQKPLTVVATDARHDLVLLTGEFECPCVSLGRRPSIDDEVISVNFPEYIDTRTQVLSIGLVQGFLEEKMVTTTLATTGSSGGGLFIKQNGEYKLVGIVTHVGATTIDTSIVGLTAYQQLQWFIHSTPVDIVKQFLKQKQPSLLR